MELGGEQRLGVDRATVWAALNDPEVLKDCIPGCEHLEKTPEGEMVAKVTAKVGPVKATFSGKVRFENVVEGVSYSIVGEGQGGVAGFAKGGADVSLEEDGAGGTVLKYLAKAHVGGKMAQLGARLIDSTAKSMAEAFFAKFAERVATSMAPAPALAGAGAPAEILADATAEAPRAQPQRPSAAPAAAPAASAPSAVAPWMLVVGGIIIIAAIYVLTRT
jgi:carbon monoxide dehydrogenase subunit G